VTAQAPPQCEDCGATGARDLRVYPASYRKSGRRNQGAMTRCGDDPVSHNGDRREFDRAYDWPYL
jgi:hypothetical protein